MVENRVKSCLTKFSGHTEYYPISVVLCNQPTNILNTKVVSIELTSPDDGGFDVNIYSINSTPIITLQKNRLTDVPCLFYYIEGLWADSAFNLN